MNKDIVRVLRNVDVRGEQECWPWMGCTRGKGYGGVRFHGKSWIASRLMWTLFISPIPKGEGFHGTCVLHSCDNPPCVNPSHLFLGSNRDNGLDAAAKGRVRNHHYQKTHCLRGHPYTDENLYTELRTGWRRCRICERIRARDGYRRRRHSE